jgi:LysR family transcriptional regulator, hydrogen peroxide-inducible genes activator
MVKSEKLTMEFYQIKYFLAVAKHNNFTHAATACNVSQPALTRAIQRLEHLMGGSLFQRDARHTSLTPLGKIILPFLQSMVEFADTAMREAKKQTLFRSVSLSIGIARTIGPQYLATLLRQLTIMSPKLEIKILHGTSREIQDLLFSGEIEIGIAAMRDIPEQIKAESLFDEYYYVAFPRGHRFEKFETVSFQDLVDENLIERLNCEYLDAINLALMKHTQQPLICYRSQDEGLIQEIVADGVGCSIVPKSLVSNPNIQLRPLANPTFQRSVSAITIRGIRHSEIQRKFLNLCITKARMQNEGTLETMLLGAGSEI